MRYDSIEGMAVRKAPGEYLGHYRVIQAGRIVAEGDMPLTYRSESEARENAHKYGAAVADGLPP